MSGREEFQTPELSIPLKMVCFIIVKAREYDEKVSPVGLEDGSDPTDDGSVAVLEEQPGDPTRAELVQAIAGLDEDSSIELVALAWLGRGDFTRDEWEAAVELAAARHNSRTAAYLAGIPNLGDCLEEGLAELGRSCEEFEMNRL